MHSFSQARYGQTTSSVTRCAAAEVTMEQWRWAWSYMHHISSPLYPQLRVFLPPNAFRLAVASISPIQRAPFSDCKALLSGAVISYRTHGIHSLVPDGSSDVISILCQWSFIERGIPTCSFPGRDTSGCSFVSRRSVQPRRSTLFPDPHRDRGRTTVH